MRWVAVYRERDGKPNEIRTRLLRATKLYLCLQVAESDEDYMVHPKFRLQTEFVPEDGEVVIYLSNYHDPINYLEYLLLSRILKVSRCLSAINVICFILRIT